MRFVLVHILLLSWLLNLATAVKCYSCANDFIVWVNDDYFHPMEQFFQQWRHFFLKRNYGLSTSDPECSHRNYKPDTHQSCHSTCFVFYLNGTNKDTGFTKTLGVGRGCSSSFLTDDQHVHLGLGTHSRPSDVGEYLPHDFDKLDLTEHWCFCATDFCNQESCFSLPFGSREFGGSYIAKRLQYSSYGNWNNRNDGYWSTAIPLVFIWSLLNL